MAQFTRGPFAKKQSPSDPFQTKSEEVAKLAYDLYLKRGGSHGNDQEDWFQAEALLRKKQR